MHIVIRASLLQQQELIQKGIPENITIDWVNAGCSLFQDEADAFFDFEFNDIDIAANELITDKPVFVHAVNCVCSEIDKPNYIRINGWPGFLNRPVIELACFDIDYRSKAENILKAFNWQYVWTEDEYGLVAARIISMIINEAYFALEQKVSSKHEIDVAMKLGTNYPYGPFEWSKKIGLASVYNLLKQMSKDARYTISDLLAYESQAI